METERERIIHPVDSLEARLLLACVAPESEVAGYSCRGAQSSLTNSTLAPHDSPPLPLHELQGCGLLHSQVGRPVWLHCREFAIAPSIGG